MIIRNEFRELSSIDNMQLKLGERWSLIDPKFLNDAADDTSAKMMSNRALPYVILKPEGVLNRPYTWFLMDVISDFLFVGVYMATLFQIVEEGRNIGPNRDSMPPILIVCMVLVFGLALTEVRGCTVTFLQ